MDLPLGGQVEIGLGTGGAERRSFDGLWVRADLSVEVGVRPVDDPSVRELVGLNAFDRVRVIAREDAAEHVAAWPPLAPPDDATRPLTEHDWIRADFRSSPTGERVRDEGFFAQCEVFHTGRISLWFKDDQEDGTGTAKAFEDAEHLEVVVDFPVSDEAFRDTWVRLPEATDANTRKGPALVVDCRGPRQPARVSGRLDTLVTAPDGEVRLQIWHERQQQATALRLSEVVTTIVDRDDEAVDDRGTAPPAGARAVTADDVLVVTAHTPDGTAMVWAGAFAGFFVGPNRHLRLALLHDQPNRRGTIYDLAWIDEVRLIDPARAPVALRARHQVKF